LHDPDHPEKKKRNATISQKNRKSERCVSYGRKIVSGRKESSVLVGKKKSVVDVTRPSKEKVEHSLCKRAAGGLKHRYPHARTRKVGSESSGERRNSSLGNVLINGEGRAIPLEFLVEKMGRKDRVAKRGRKRILENTIESRGTKG